MGIGMDIVEGDVCSECTMPFVTSHGYPVVCKSCWREAKRDGLIKRVDGVEFVGMAQQAIYDVCQPPKERKRKKKKRYKRMTEDKGK